MVVRLSGIIQSADRVAVQAVATLQTPRIRLCKSDGETDSGLAAYAPSLGVKLATPGIIA